MSSPSELVRGQEDGSTSDVEEKEEDSNSDEGLMDVADTTLNVQQSSSSLPSRPSFMAKFVNDKDAVRDQFISVDVGNCRESLNSPPVFNLERMVSELFCTTRALGDIDVTIEPEKPCLPPTAMLVTVLSQKVGLRFDVQTWTFSLGVDTESDDLRRDIEFPIRLMLTPGTYLLLNNPSDVFRFVSEVDCQCDSKRTTKRPTHACLECSMKCKIVIEGNAVELTFVT